MSVTDYMRYRRVVALVEKWREAAAGGLDPSPVTLCKGCPELIPEVADAIETCKRVRRVLSAGLVLN